MNSKVALLKTVRGYVIAVYADAAKANSQANKYNLDPRLSDGSPDPDAPYSVDEWTVME